MIETFARLFTDVLKQVSSFHNNAMDFLLEALHSSLQFSVHFDEFLVLRLIELLITADCLNIRWAHGVQLNEHLGTFIVELIKLNLVGSNLLLQLFAIKFERSDESRASLSVTLPFPIVVGLVLNCGVELRRETEIFLAQIFQFLRLLFDHFFQGLNAENKNALADRETRSSC